MNICKEAAAPFDLVGALENVEQQIRAIKEHLAAGQAGPVGAAKAGRRGRKSRKSPVAVNNGTVSTTTKNQRELINLLLARLALKNDAALCRVLNVQPPMISKIRNGRSVIGASLLLRIHEKSGLSISQLKLILKPSLTSGIKV